MQESFVRFETKNFDFAETLSILSFTKYICIELKEGYIIQGYTEYNIFTLEVPYF